MKNIIKLLPDSIANQIAAGEVVQRPSSVVKELLENSIDAGGTEVKLVIKNAGKQLIQVLDNGKGMGEIDLRMAFERHATSKIQNQDDLFQIHTLGFRGEALASIAAVAQVEARSSTDSLSNLGTKLSIDGSNIISQELVSVPTGTNIAVKNLFFNVPARRNFLKSNTVEFKHIVDEFQRIALSHPKTGFYLYNESKEIYHLPQTKLISRIIHIFGKNYRDRLIECGEETQYVKINGFIGKPEYAKKTRGEQFFFVNNRFIKNTYLHHAVKSAFQNLLQGLQFPFYVLFLEIDPVHIDINVHPSKAEIKFDDERLIYSVLNSAIRKSISAHHLLPPIDFHNDVNSGESRLLNSVSKKNNKFNNNSHDYVNFKHYDKRNSFTFDKLFDDNVNNKKNHELEKGNEILLNQSILSNSNKRLSKNIDLHKNKSNSFDAIPYIHNNENVSNNKSQNTDFKSFLSFNDKAYHHFTYNGYIITYIKSGLIIIDQKAAYHRILYEKFISTINNSANFSQQLIFPTKILLSDTDIIIFKDFYKSLENIGFNIVIDENNVVVKGLPSEVADHDLVELIEGFIEQFKLNKNISLDIYENLAQSLSVRLATRSKRQLNQEEIRSIIDRLFACENPKYTPDGDLTYIKISSDEIHKRFKDKNIKL